MMNLVMVIGTVMSNDRRLCIPVDIVTLEEMLLD